jgi:hypothetical protein
MAANAEKAERVRGSIADLQHLRGLMEAVVEDNQQLRNRPGQQASAARRIAEATRQIQDIDREIAELQAVSGR